MTAPLGGGLGRLWDLEGMLRFYAEKFLKAYFLANQLEIASKDKAAVSIDPAAVPAILVMLNDLSALLQDLSLEMSLKTSRQLVENFSSRGSLPSLGLAGDLARRMHDEIESQHFLALSPSERRSYEMEHPFGDVVAIKFPSAAYDIEEASKCLALNRSTASAFHSIRCLESAVRAMARCLGVPDPTKASDRNWGRMLGTVKDAMDLRWPGSSARMAGDGKFFEEQYAALAAMQNPWRNATMHLDQKYTLEEAQHIFANVGNFMRRLASRCDENGEPLI